jgi:hypothetical protein
MSFTNPNPRRKNPEEPNLENEGAREWGLLPTQQSGNSFQAKVFWVVMPPKVVVEYQCFRDP